MPYAVQRNSVWCSLSTYPEVPQRPKARRSSTFGSSRPSTSSSVLDVIDEGDRQTHFTTRTTRRPVKDFESHQASKRASFIDLGHDSSRDFSDNGLLGSLKGRLHRKSSAPSLSSSSFVSSDSASTIMAPTTPTKSSKTLHGIKWPSPGRSLREKANPLRQSLSLSPRSARKSSGGTKTPIAVPQPIRPRRRYSQDETDTIVGVEGSEARYQPLSLARKGCSRFHKYSPSEAPYMQCYNKVNLQNDSYTNLLLQRLNTNGTPSFHDYAMPPLHVLDLGCGQGLWAKEAASAWAEHGTHIIGFDLVDLIDKAAEASESISWRRGNFLLHQLPFKTGSFDLVRLANLTEAIPRTRWEHVLRECRRVMKPAGRLEIIDDELTFSYPETIQGTEWTKAPYWDAELQAKSNRSSWGSSSLSKSVSSKSSSSRLSDEMSSSFLDMDGATAVEAAPSLICDDSPSEDSFESLPTPATSNESFETQVECSAGRAKGFKSETAFTACRQVEKIYETMLESEYGVDPRPGQFLEELLNKIFGQASGVKTLKDHTLYILYPEYQELVNNTKSTKRNTDDPSGTLKRMFEEKIATSRPSSVRGRKDKASRLLGEDIISLSRPSINVEDPSRDAPDALMEPALIKTPSRTPSLVSLNKQIVLKPAIAALKTKKRYKPNGLYIFPDKFLEMSSEELEWHVLKHTNTLLGCRAALDKFVASLTDEDGNQVVDEEEWHDMLWEYESTRRLRFNLPGIGGGFDELDEDLDSSQEPTGHPSPINPGIRTFIADNRPSAQDDGCDVSLSCHPVRRIRVFEAFKL